MTRNKPQQSLQGLYVHTHKLSTSIVDFHGRQEPLTAIFADKVLFVLVGNENGRKWGLTQLL
jgi:hypothetical protein